MTTTTLRLAPFPVEQSVDEVRRIIAARQHDRREQPPVKLYRFALINPCDPFADPEFIGHPFEVQRRHWGQVREAMLQALDNADSDGRVVALLEWLRTSAIERGAA